MTPAQAKQAWSELHWSVRWAVSAAIIIFTAGATWASLKNDICKNTERISQVEQDVDEIVIKASDDHERLIRIEAGVENINKTLDKLQK